MDGLTRIRYITRNFDALQGLRMVPFGFYFLALGAGWLGEQGDLSLGLPALVLTLIAYWLTGRYYASRYGLVTATKAGRAANLLVPLGVILLLWGAAALDFWLRLPVSILGLTMAVVLLGLWWLHEQRNRVHYAVMGGLVALISLMPLGGVGQGWSIIQPPGALFSLLLGGIFVVGGILDHLILVNNFKITGDQRE